MKCIYQILLGIIFGLIGCSNIQNHGDEIESYYYNPDWFEKPMVYEYLYTTKDTSYFMYHEFKKINSHELELTITGVNLNIIGKRIYEYRNDGVYAKEYYTNMYWSSKGYIKEEIFDNLIFPYNSSGKNFGTSYTVRLSDNITSKRTNKLKFDNYDIFQLNGENIKIIKVVGISEGIIKGKRESNDIILNYDEVLFFGKNVGLIYHESRNKDRINKLTLKRRITIEEFEKIKNAR